MVGAAAAQVYHPAPRGPTPRRERRRRGCETHAQGFRRKSARHGAAPSFAPACQCGHLQCVRAFWSSADHCSNKYVVGCIVKQLERRTVLSFCAALSPQTDPYLFTYLASRSILKSLCVCAYQAADESHPVTLRLERPLSWPLPEQRPPSEQGGGSNPERSSASRSSFGGGLLSKVAGSKGGGPACGPGHDLQGSRSSPSSGSEGAWAAVITATLSPPCSPCCSLSPTPSPGAVIPSLADVTDLFR